ncbi:MAG: Co2+/Mg2+ efflux protein ApaG [Deinococcota bacterium]|jgi:ApaG protein|nr:Co2+/Mg2+ efflux protein ApaG [Deinococcota bacterium]
MAKASTIEIAVRSFYLPDHSQPDLRRYMFGYTISITNNGQSSAQLLDRHWTITDALGRVQEVDGQGVVGKQPVIAPGQTYEYSSGCPLATPYGYMQGSYGMVSESGERFSVEVPMFVLGKPDKRTLN